MPVHIPTPLLLPRSAELIQAAREQVREPPDPRVLPWEPLPPVDPRAVAREAARRQASRPSEPAPSISRPAAVASAFAGAEASSAGPEGTRKQESGFKIVHSTPSRPRSAEKPTRPKRPADTDDLAARLKREWLKD